MTADGTFKRRRPPALLVELAVIVAVLTGAAFGVYYGSRPPPVHDVLPLGGVNVPLGKLLNPQWEPTVAVDPASPRVLFAASVDGAVDARVYDSRDGGTTWTSRPAPPSSRAPCGLSHPAVGAGPSGLEVMASLVTTLCSPADPLLQVATRNGPTGSWRVRSLAPRGRYAFDERPAVTVDSHGSILVAWPRLYGEIVSHQVLLLVRSDDGGRSWTAARRVGDYTGVYSVALAAGSPGELYLAVADGKRHSLDLLASRDAGATWTRRRLARLVERYSLGCGEGTIVVPAQPQLCVGPQPSVVVAGTNVVVVYAEPDARGREGIDSVTADRRLRTARPVHVSPVGDNADRFDPVAAVDRTTGDVWACYYDTSGDSARKHPWFTCTRSRDGGRHWAAPVHAASEASNEAADGSNRFGYGQTEGLAAAGGVAHAVWTDTRDTLTDEDNIYTAAIPGVRLVRR